MRLSLLSRPNLICTNVAGMLVRVECVDPDPEPNPVVRRPVGSLVVRDLPPTLLRKRLSR